MAGNLTQKERMLLHDQLSHEEICISKYTGYASRAKDPQVKNMFNEFASEEQQHYNTITGLLQGGGAQGQTGTSGAQAGTMGTQGKQSASQQGSWMSDTRTVYGGQLPQAGQAGSASQGAQSGASSQLGSQAKAGRGPVDFEAGVLADMTTSVNDDKSMLSDMLMTEKFISGAYDTALFEAANPQVRQSLQHIQKDEQKHGEDIFNYMRQSGMYKPQ